MAPQRVLAALTLVAALFAIGALAQRKCPHFLNYNISTQMRGRKSPGSDQKVADNLKL
jgi:hypothetical protein